MPTLTISTTTVDGQALSKAQCDETARAIESFLNTTKIDDNNIQAGGVGTASLATGAVTATKLGTAAVETAKINDLAVTTAKINDLAVTTGKINDLAVTQGKRAALGQQVSSSCGTFTTASGSLVDITNLSVTITTTGRPVWVGLISDGSGSSSYIAAVQSSGATALAHFALIRGSTEIARVHVNMASGSGSATALRIPGSSLQTIDTGASAGSNTYKAQALISSGSSADALNLKLMAYEL